MLTLSSIADTFDDLFRLFYPHLCPVCGGLVEGRRQTVCSRCSADAPYTGFEIIADNPVSRRVWNIIPAQNACSMLYYIHDGRWRNLVSNFKFKGKWKFALDMGRIFGASLSQSPLYGNVDTVIPVPLHPWRTMSRGYNQSEYLARGIAGQLGARVDTRSVRRTRHNRSQRTVDKTERWDNVNNLFEVRHPESLKGRHILLVDDVFTTGATIISLGEAVLRAVPDCRISIATLFVSKQELGIRD